MPRDVESGRSPRAQHGPALSPRSPAALGASHSVTSSLDTLARSGRRSAARAQRSPLPGMWLHALDPVVLLALFVLSGLFISEEGEPGHRRPTVPFEVYLWNSILNTFNWHSTLFDVVLLSTCRTLAATGLAGAARKHPALRSSVFLRTCLYVFVCLTLGLTLAKLVKLAQDSDAAHAGLPIPVPVTAFVVGVSLLFGVAEVVSLLHHLREWCEKLDYAALAEQQQEAETEAGEEASPDEVPVVRRIRWSRLGSLMYDDLNLILLGLAMLAFNSAIGLIIPLYFGKIVDSVTSSSGNLDMLKGVMVELCLWFIASGITGFARSLAFTLTGYRIVKNVRSQVFRAITMQEIAFFDESSTGELTSRLSSDAQVLQSALTVDLSMLLRFLAQAVGSIVILFSLSWKLTLVMFSCVPLIAIGAVIYGNYVSGMQEQFQDLLAETQTVAQEIISQIRTVRSFAKELRSQDKYNHAIEEAHRIGVRISVVQALFMGLTGFLPQIAIALVLYFGAVMIVNGEISGGLLTSFLLYTLALAMAFGVLSNLFGDFMQAVGASQRIFDLMDRVPIVPLSGGASIRDFRGKIEFKDVSFSYPTRKDAQILKGVSLTLEPGTVLALVGPSGQGKSTIMALILRFYDVDSGSIMIDDRLDIKVIDLQWFRSEIGYVSQEPVLFSGTIAENIAYGWHRQDRQPTLQEIIEAATQARSQHHAIKCRFANAHQFIDQFPDKYDTAVGERGVQLSGGQKQRIAIARAFLMNPKILLLDEATSALDAEASSHPSEHLVQEAIDRAMRGRTVVVIAHRLSTVINATKIAVIENGQVAESGNHQELMGPSGRGIYRGLVMRQMNGRIGDKGTSSDVEAGGVIAAGTTVQLAGPAVGSRTAGDAVVTSVTSLVSIPPLEDADDPVRRSSGAGAAAAIPSKDMATSPPKQPVSRPVVQNLGGEPDEGSASSAANESTAGPGTPRAAIKKLFTKKSRK